LSAPNQTNSTPRSTRNAGNVAGRSDAAIVRSTSTARVRSRGNVPWGAVIVLDFFFIAGLQVLFVERAE